MGQSPQQVGLARELRRRQTEAEKTLWNKLRNLQLDGVKFRRQQPIGAYIVDYVSFDKKLVVEIDGGQHNRVPMKKRRTKRNLPGERGFSYS